MSALLLNLLLAFSVSGTVRAGAHAIVDHLSDDVNVHVSDKVRAIVERQRDSDSASDSEADDDSDLEAVPPRAPPPPTPQGGRLRIRVREDSASDLPAFSESGHNVPTVDVLHRIARRAGWSLTIVGVAKERIDVDLKDIDPRDAAREVLKASGSMGVLRRGKLVV